MEPQRRPGQHSNGPVGVFGLLVADWFRYLWTFWCLQLPWLAHSSAALSKPESDLELLT